MGAGRIAALALLLALPGLAPAAPPSPGTTADEMDSLVRALGSGEEERWRAEMRLAELGEAAVPALLRGAEGGSREAVAAVLAGLGGEGALPAETAVAGTLAALIREGDETGELAAEALSSLAELRGQRAIPLLIGLLGAGDPHADRESRALARRILVRAAGRDLGAEPGTWEDWWSGERKRYLEREVPRSLPDPTPEEFERATQTVQTARALGTVMQARIRFAGAGLVRRRPGPPVPRGGRWLLETTFDGDFPVWPWGIFPVRLWIVQGERRTAARLLPALDPARERASQRTLAVAPSSLDPDESADVVAQMLDARSGNPFLLVFPKVRFSEER